MRRPIAALVLALAVVVVALAGCGGAEKATPSSETVEGTLPEDATAGGSSFPALDLTGDPYSGAAVWEASGCARCHTLAAAGSSGTIGPDLDGRQPSLELVVERVTLGLGPMPVFGDTLSPQEIADVAQYVVDSTSG